MLDELKDDVNRALTGQLRSAALYHPTTVDDGYGNQVPGGWGAPHLCEGIRGSYDAEYAGLSGIPRTAAKIELLAGTLDIVPQRLDKIEIEGGSWLITEIEIDPAGVLWVCQCSEATP